MPKNINSLLQNRFSVFLLYFFLAAIAFHQLSLLNSSLKWDSLDFVLPLRHLVGDYLNQGELPLWNPFSQMGNPICTDPQVWYPPTLILGKMFGYTYATLSYDFILHIALAGYSFFCLALGLKTGRATAFISGICYMFCGFFISNAEHASFIIHASWIPLFLHFSIQLCRSLSYSYALKTAITLFMMVTGGYPAFLFVLFYFSLALIFYYGLRFCKQKKYQSCFRLFLLHFFVLLITLLLCSPWLYASFLFRSEMVRDGAIPLWMIMTNPFPPTATLSFMYPFLLLRREFFPSDISMINAYFGIVPLLFFMVAVFSGMNKKRILLLSVFLFFLLASFGEGFFVRKFLFERVPFMDLFRHPSIFRIFVIISALLIAVEPLDMMLSRKINNEVPKLPRPLLFSAVVVFLGLSLYSSHRLSAPLNQIGDPSVYGSSPSLNVYDCLFVQGINHVVVLSLCCFFLFSKKNTPLRFRKALTIAVIFWDLYLSVQLNFYFTVGNQDKNYAAFRNNSVLKNIRDKAVSWDTARYYRSQGFNPEGLAPALNLNLFYRSPSADGYDPFMMKEYKAFMESPLKPLVDSNSIAYFPSVQKSFSDSVKRKFTRTLYGDECKNGLMDTAGENVVEEIRFSPNNIHLKLRTKKKSCLVLLQNYSPLWKANAQGEELNIIKANASTMAVLVPAGTSQLNFRFHLPYMSALFFLSMAVLCFVVIYLIFTENVFYTLEVEQKQGDY